MSNNLNESSPLYWILKEETLIITVVRHQRLMIRHRSELSYTGLGLLREVLAELKRMQTHVSNYFWPYRVDAIACVPLSRLN